MNEMKIRFWDKKLNVMWEPIELKKLLRYMLFQSMPNSDGYTALKDHFDDMVIEQFTGLKGKNGKESYEGDRVNFTVFDYNGLDTQYTGVIVFTGQRFQIWQSAESEFYGSDGGFELDWVYAQDEEIEVIGNIHEDKP